MTVSLEDQENIVSNRGRTVTKPRFADDIDGLAVEAEELAKLVQHLDKAPSAYGMENSAEKIQLMTRNISGINVEIKLNGQKLETIQASGTWAQLYLTRVQSLRCSPG